MPAALHHRAQELGASLPPLLIEAERVAQVVQQGIHGRRRAGTGETFWQFRRYEQGDMADRIDWRQSARTDALFVREREWEAAQSAYIWADTSGSMNYSSSQNLTSKAECAQLLMLTLSSLLLRGGEKIIWLGNHPVSVHGKNGLMQIAAQAEHAGQSGNLPPDIHIHRDAQMILCSDFLMPPDELRARIRNYAARRVRGVLIHILDPLENELNLEGRLDIHGLEGEAPLLAPNADALKQEYQQRMAAHKDELKHIAASAGWLYLSHVTDAPPAQILLRLYEALAKGPA